MIRTDVDHPDRRRGGREVPRERNARSTPMLAKPLRTLEVGSRREWRAWLQDHHDSEAEIWLVFPKRHTGRASLSYDDAVEEALCFGWVDSLIRRLDDDRYARKFTPRRPDSK